MRTRLVFAAMLATAAVLSPAPRAGALGPSAGPVCVQIDSGSCSIAFGDAIHLTGGGATVVGAMAGGCWQLNGLSGLGVEWETITGPHCNALLVWGPGNDVSDYAILELSVSGPGVATLFWG